MKLKSVEQTSYKGMYKIAPEQGAAIYVRKEYLPDFNCELLAADAELSDDEFNMLLESGFTCVVELKAVQYLARAEQSRFGLTRKLIEKKYEKKHIEAALDFLEQIDYLSDERYARAWLNSRRINHYEGTARLKAELQVRGISREIIDKAVKEFFTENDEYEICKKAYLKQQKAGKDGDKLLSALQKSGFTFKMIKLVKEELEI